MTIKLGPNVKELFISWVHNLNLFIDGWNGKFHTSVEYNYELLQGSGTLLPGTQCFVDAFIQCYMLYVLFHFNHHS